jgi:uncharacterized membrane protein YbhN (UPF0104 family)
LKVLFGVGLFTWMVTSGKLNLAQVAGALSKWPMMLAILALGYLQIGITTWRWKMLLRAQDILLSFRQAWDLMMIGMLFNVVIPGAVGGDLIKGYYITRATVGKKSNAAITVLVDRIIGLIGLLFLGAVVVVADWNGVMAAPATRSLGAITVGSTLGVFAFLYAAVLAGGRLAEAPLPTVARNVFRALSEYRTKGSVIPISLILSIFNQALTCATYWVALRATGVTDMPISQFFLVVPLGLIVSAIPIAPGGVGVGQAGFFALFQIAAPAYATLGTDAYTVFQVMFILICLSGLYWYIPYKNINLDGVAPA